MVLRDSFLASDKVKIVMLACVCPGSSSSDHTLNTLRYAERLKEKTPLQQQQPPSLAEQRRLEAEMVAFRRQSSQVQTPQAQNNLVDLSKHGLNRNKSTVASTTLAS